MATQMSLLHFILHHAYTFPFTATQNPIKLLEIFIVAVECVWGGEISLSHLH